jgi:hypothetical protein
MVSFLFIVLLLSCLDVSTVLFKFKVQKKKAAIKVRKAVPLHAMQASRGPTHF